MAMVAFPGSGALLSLGWCAECRALLDKSRQIIPKALNAFHNSVQWRCGKVPCGKKLHVAGCRALNRMPYMYIPNGSGLNSSYLECTSLRSNKKLIDKIVLILLNYNYMVSNRLGISVLSKYGIIHNSIPETRVYYQFSCLKRIRGTHSR